MPGDPIYFFLPWRTVAEKIKIFRNIFVIVSIAISRLGPLLFPEDPRPIREKLIELDNILLNQIEISKDLVGQAVSPFATDQKGPGALPNLLQQIHLEKSLENDPAYKLAVDAFKAKMNE